MRFIPLGPSSYIPATIKAAPKLVAMKLSHHQSWRLVKSCPLGKEPRNRLEKTQDQNKSSQGETKGSGSSQEKCSLVHNLLPVNSTIATQKWVFGDILEKKITNCLYFKVSLILALQTCLTFFFVFCWNLNVLRNNFFFDGLQSLIFVLKQPCIHGINLSWSLCIILFTYCWIQFANALRIFFIYVLERYWCIVFCFLFSLWYLCLIMVLGFCWPHGMSEDIFFLLLSSERVLSISIISSFC